jgi:hypothetical protein
MDLITLLVKIKIVVGSALLTLTISIFILDRLLCSFSIPKESKVYLGFLSSPYKFSLF